MAHNLHSSGFAAYLIRRPPVVLALAALLPAACGGGEVVERETVLAMDTAVELTVVASDAETAGAALEAAKQAIRAVEDWASATEPTSELSLINTAGHSDSPSPSLRECLDLALSVAEASGGAFDPTVRPLLEAYGFTGEDWRVPAPEELDRALERVGYEALAFDDGRLVIPDGYSLDLGGAAKGYAVDRALEALKTTGASGGLVNAGGDIACFGERPGGGAWRVGVQHPRDAEAMLIVLELESGAVATSGDYERCFTVDGVRYHHLLNPRTGEPARELCSVTVTAPTCAAADAYATAVFILGPREGLELLERTAELGGMLIESNNELTAHLTSRFPTDGASGEID